MLDPVHEGHAEMGGEAADLLQDAAVGQYGSRGRGDFPSTGKIVYVLGA
ncbi:hypothetical protein SZN_29600 [Streptomyces zinciresistens K42]|uniref:Uncharacterized protein n=1 Tax=Streptomyces zinciresistens K42 TaxID=700597 RepID=G2GK77_9ACTN|nr:hypothetical protein SZN_29600 [Streptomyces zinciresistens K42]